MATQTTFQRIDSRFVTEHKSDGGLFPSNGGVCKSVQHCLQAHKLIQTLNNHIKHDDIIDMDSPHKEQIVSDYLHVIYQHDTESEFEWIVHQCVNCDIAKCTIHMRKQSASLFSSHQQIAFEQILNKFHCYFLHCFDSGYRLTSTEKEILHAEDSEAQFIKINQILRAKRNQHKVNVERMKRYNQLECVQTHEDTNALGVKSEYHFGVRFQYDHNKEDTHGFDNNAMQCMPRYSSFKDELLQNAIGFITMDQFRTESGKAKLYHAAQRNMLLNASMDIPIECILALLVYCNYTSLQHRFSKTYRKEHAQDHSHFYYFGKLLKQSVQVFGEIGGCTQHKSFYHGINESLSMPAFACDTTAGIRIYAPLSTSIAYPVAVNFARTDGLVIQFACTNETRHFATSWLSDFANEQEYLFVQNNSHFENLHINDIVIVETGCSYEPILEALKAFNLIIRNSYTYRKDSASILMVIRDIISQQLTPSNASLNEYYRQLMCTAFLKNVTSVSLDFKYYHTLYSTYLDILLHSAYNWFNLQSMNALFPNMKLFAVSNIKLSVDIFECVLKDIRHSYHTITSIYIHTINTSTLSAGNAVDTYTEAFANLGWFLVGNLYNRQVHMLHQRSATKIALFLVDHLWENLYYLDDEGTIEKETHKLLESQSCTAEPMNVCVNWNNIALNPKSYFVRHFCKPQRQWLNMKMITKVFPNITTLYVECISLSSFIFDDVLRHLRTNDHCIWRVALQDIHRATSKEFISKYKQEFKQIGFDIHSNKQNNIDSIIIEKQSDKAVMSEITSILDDTLEDTTPNIDTLNARLFHDTSISEHLKKNAVSYMMSSSQPQHDNAESHSQHESGSNGCGNGKRSSGCDGSGKPLKTLETRPSRTLHTKQQRLDAAGHVMATPIPPFCNTQPVHTSHMPLYSVSSYIPLLLCNNKQKSESSHPPPSKGADAFIKHKAQPHGMLRSPFIDKNGKYQRFRSTSYSFSPSVSISRRLACEIIPERIQETFDSASDIWEYMNITIAMQFNDSMNQFNFAMNKPMIPINCNFHASTADRQPLYCLVKGHGLTNWKLEEALFTKTDVFRTCGLESLPIASRLQSNFQRQLQHGEKIRHFMQQTNQRKSVSDGTKWTKVVVYSKPNNTQRNIHQISKRRFVKHLQHNTFDGSNVVPIIMFYDGMHRVEYVWIVTITGKHCNINVGISMIYNVNTNRVEVTGIHVDKMDIIKQHRWVPILSQNTMKIPQCLQTFASCDHIAIGNPDTANNHIKNLLGEHRRLRDRIHELEQQNERKREFVANASIPSETTASTNV